MKSIHYYKLRTKYDIDAILENTDCHRVNPKYDEYKEHLIHLIGKTLPMIEPMGYFVILDSAIEKADRKVYCMVSLGKAIDAEIKRCFAEYEYFDALLLNSLADHLLFEATNHLYEYIHDRINESKLHLTVRQEPGTGKVSMQVQREVYDIIMENFDLDIGITEGLMLFPSKTLAYFYGITSEACNNGLDHDCSNCDSQSCIHRKYIIKIEKDDETLLIQGRKGENLLDLLRKKHINVESPCSGKGTCGKCKVKAVGHDFAMQEAESRFLTEDEKTNDIVLACFHTIEKDLHLVFKTDKLHHEIETGFAPIELKNGKKFPEIHDSRRIYGLGVDIGTTTVVVSLVNVQTQEIMGVKKILNPQKAYGADIITRIMYVNQHDDNELSTMIRQTIERLSLELLEDNTLSGDMITEMVISGNTTMIYLLLNINPEALAVSPFTTVEMGLKVLSAEEIFTSLKSFDITILPFITAYVGGDIVSGLYANHLHEKDNTLVFVDIGTNGEMVLITGGRMISAATAAGPAFEGANIRCGMGAVSGAICEISLSETIDETGQVYDIKTLGESEPEGICGSALIDAIAVLHKQGFVDDSGFMAEPVMLYKEIGIYPSDIRQVQLAKAAILAGVGVLLEEEGLSFEDIDAFYIAGGFGSHLNVENSAYIGLIPNEVLEKVVVVGNASLAGSIRYLLEEDARLEIETIKVNCEYIELSTNMKFYDAYINGMAFGGNS